MMYNSRKGFISMDIKRIIAISDTHSFHHDVFLPEYQEGDILVHAGDITHKGELSILTNFSQWLHSLPYEKILVVAGNHDWCFVHQYHNSKNILERDEGKVIYLQDDVVEIGGLKFYGSPYQPTFHNWAFNLDRGDIIERKWSIIPDDVDILITHGPAKGHVGGILRTVMSGRQMIEDLGCQDLMDRIVDINPIYHICGHIHDGYGSFTSDLCDTRFINASICTESYKPANSPFILPIKESYE